MKIIEAADYILGKKFIGTIKSEPYRGDKELLEIGKKLLNKHATAATNLKILETPQSFFRMEPDMEQDVKAHLREELFYSLKLDMVSPVIPAKSLFLIYKMYQLYGTLNLITKVFPKNDLEDLFSEGYIADGHSVRDVICTLIDNKYTPLSVGQLVVPNKDNWDVYIGETDMVAILPTKIKELLTHDDILRLTVKDKNIMLGTKPIRFLGSYYGGVNSTYDLSGIV
jgi:hypothetical protein